MQNLQVLSLKKYVDIIIENISDMMAIRNTISLTSIDVKI